MPLIRNEQTKLTATFLNGLGLAVFAVGGLAPVFSGVFNGTGPTVVHLATTGVCFFAALALHYAGRQLLRRLE